MFLWASTSLQDSLNIYSLYLNFFHDCNLLSLFTLLLFISSFFMSIFFNSDFKSSYMEPQAIEVIWTFVPCLILIMLGGPSLYLLYSAEGLEFSSMVTVKCIGHQWYWEYEYPNFSIQFDSFMVLEEELSMGAMRLLEVDNLVTLPFGGGCRILVMSADVLHAWALPSMGVKLDANPGRMNQGLLCSWAPGSFFGQCSELCGVNHSFMPIKVDFTSPSLFIHWLTM